MSGRCLVLNADMSFLHCTRHWTSAVSLVLKEKVSVLKAYDHCVRSEKLAIPVPAVVVLREYRAMGGRRAQFNYPSKKNILIREDFKCSYCLKPLSFGSVTRDHVVPTSRGGPDSILNVVASCKICNGKKGARTPKEAGMTLHLEPRPLTDEEKLSALVKLHKAWERQAWLSCLRENNIKLY